MSKFIDEIIEDMGNNPETYKSSGPDYAIAKIDNSFCMYNIMTPFFMGVGNMILQINGKSLKITYRDALKLARASKKWHENVSFKQLLTEYNDD